MLEIPQTYEKYKHSKIKSLIVAGPKDEEIIPDYAQEGVHKKSVEASSEDLEDEAVRTALAIMRSPDGYSKTDVDSAKLKLEAAKASMQWLGKDGKKANTTIFSTNAQVNQIANNPKHSSHILKAIEDIAMITDGKPK